MFGAYKTARKFDRASAHWSEVTRIDLRDGGRITRQAEDFMTSLRVSAEDAWVIAATNWMTGMTRQESRRLVAEGMLAFLSARSARFEISGEIARIARVTAEDILH